MRFPYLTAILTIGAFTLILTMTVGVFAVEGRSMAPELAPGQVVLVNRLAFAFRHPIPGDLLIFRSPVDGDLTVKRLRQYHRPGVLELRGDNTGISIDSRHYGGVPTTDILGRVIFVGRAR